MPPLLALLFRARFGSAARPQIDLQFTAFSAFHFLPSQVAGRPASRFGANSMIIRFHSKSARQVRSQQEHNAAEENGMGFNFCFSFRVTL